MGRKPKNAATSRIEFSERIEIKATAKEKAAFQTAAERHGISLSQWLRLAAWQAINDHDGAVKLVDLDAISS